LTQAVKVLIQAIKVLIEPINCIDPSYQSFNRSY
jgi:hypothetical protein